MLECEPVLVYLAEILATLRCARSPLRNGRMAFITEQGEVTVETTEAFLRQYMEDLHAFIARVYTVLPRNA